MVKDLLSMKVTQVQSLSQEDPLEKGMTTHSSILPWRIPWTEEPGKLPPMGLQRVGHNWAINTLNRKSPLEFLIKISLTPRVSFISAI